MFYKTWRIRFRPCLSKTLIKLHKNFAPLTKLGYYSQFKGNNF
jgi:hypothetical protein